METQWPIYTVFYYLQVLELYFENIAERQLLFDFFSMHLLTLHDKERRFIDPPILSSSSSDADDGEDGNGEAWNCYFCILFTDDFFYKHFHQWLLCEIGFSTHC